MANFADDCTPYDFGNNTDEVLTFRFRNTPYGDFLYRYKK